MSFNHTSNSMASGLVLLFVCCLFGKYNGVQGDLTLSRQEVLQVEKQLRHLNKPATKTIKTDHGELYDCVDFYMQPAFDHPKLKNHSYHFQMKPKFPIKESGKVSRKKPSNIGLKDEGCPIGAVPIKRTTKDDLIREKLASRYNDFSGTYSAVIRTKNTGNFTGAGGFISIYNPKVEREQYSAARIKLQNGDEFIEFGWRVDPTVYGDNLTHFFIQTNSTSGRCIDARCGFVVTSRELPPGISFPPQNTSTMGRSIMEVRLRVQKDINRNWWLTIRPDNHPVGFWPHKLFEDLADSATYADWGGEVHSPHHVLGPPMGSGVAPSDEGNRMTNAYIRWVKAIDFSGNEIDPEVERFDTDSEEDIYNVIDDPTHDPVWGHMVYFGGKTI